MQVVVLKNIEVDGGVTPAVQAVTACFDTEAAPRAAPPVAEPTSVTCIPDADLPRSEKAKSGFKWVIAHPNDREGWMCAIQVEGKMMRPLGTQVFKEPIEAARAINQWRVAHRIAEHRPGGWTAPQHQAPPPSEEANVTQSTEAPAEAAPPSLTVLASVCSTAGTSVCSTAAAADVPSTPGTPAA